MQGRRLPDREFPEQPGDYALVTGDWVVQAPDGSVFMLASESKPDSKGRHHEVEVHGDGTISVLPQPGNSNSVMSPAGWHGYIRRGVWEHC